MSSYWSLKQTHEVIQLGEILFVSLALGLKLTNPASWTEQLGFVTTANARQTADNRLPLLRMMLEHDWKSEGRDRKHRRHKSDERWNISVRIFLSTLPESERRFPHGGLEETEHVIVTGAVYDRTTEESKNFSSDLQIETDGLTKQRDNCGSCTQNQR